MRYVIPLLPILIPALFWAWYHYYKDRKLPEPVSHLLVACVAGVAAFWLGTLMYRGLGLAGLRYDAYVLAETDTTALFFYALLAIGPIEEFVKLVPFVVLLRFAREFDEPVDGIIYASFIALGFAGVENLRYLQFVTPIEALARGFAGPVIHIVFASIWGYWIGRAYLEGRKILWPALGSLCVSALLHGFFDFLVIALPRFALPGSALMIVSLWLWRVRLIRRLTG